jgi:hypothetical protein
MRAADLGDPLVEVLNSSVDLEVGGLDEHLPLVIQQGTPVGEAVGDGDTTSQLRDLHTRAFNTLHESMTFYLRIVHKKGFTCIPKV